jgi:hypothetical protein
MSGPTRFLAVVVGIVFFPALCLASIVGDYSSTYEGMRNVRITKHEDVYKVRWDLADGSHWVGVGLLNEKGDTFTVASVVSKGRDDEYVNASLHISVYKVVQEGGRITRLVSECARFGDKVTHRELLVPQKRR